MAVASSGTAKVTLPSESEILITREFAAGRALVWRAWTEPELVERWWAGRRGTMESVEIDLRVGGTWRYVMTGGVAFHGEFREIVPEERIVTTEVYEGAPPSDAGDVLNVVDFVERDGRTTLDLLVQCPNQEIRDAIMESGMEIGMQEQYDVLEEFLVSLQS
jgi:uncharacterized protein YndB with AHSA1/START domain